MMIKTIVMTVALVVLSHSALYAQSIRNEIILPIPMAETHERVKLWLTYNGYQLVPGYSNVGQKEIIAEKGDERLTLVLKNHSALGTKLIALCENRIAGQACGDSIFQSLTADYGTGKRSDTGSAEQILPKQSIQTDAIVCIYADAWGREAQFTGFVINQDGLIMCTAHDLNPELEVVVTFSDGSRFPGKVLKRDAMLDLSLISVNKRTDNFIDLRKGRDTIEEGEALFGSTCVENPSARILPGHVSGPPRRAEEHVFWQVQMDIVPGSSGSPVFDASGNIVAVVKGRRRGQDSIGFLIPFQTLVEFIEGDISQ